MVQSFCHQVGFVPQVYLAQNQLQNQVGLVSGANAHSRRHQALSHLGGCFAVAANIQLAHGVLGNNGVGAVVACHAVAGNNGLLRQLVQHGVNQLCLGLRIVEGFADDSVIDYGFHGVVQHVDESILNELETMMDDGVQSTKVYMTYGYKIDDDGILEVLKKMKELHGITAFHCENHYVVEHLKKEYGDAGKTAPIYHAKSRPNLAEAEAVRRVLYLAKLAGDAPVYIVHLSCKESLEAVEEARRNGQKNIFVETCTQYLTLTEDRYKDPDGLKYIMSPPLRTQQDLDALWKGLEAGEIQIVATDHCPFNYAKEKQDGKDDFRKCPNGAPGVEERMILLFSEGVMKNKISINKLVEVACTNPAKVYGMYPKKGIIEPGADGDLVIIDADAKQTLTHKMMHGAVDYTSYEGTDLHGKIDLVMQRGNIIAENNEFKGNRGDGKYLYRKPFLGDL